MNEAHKASELLANRDKLLSIPEKMCRQSLNFINRYTMCTKLNIVVRYKAEEVQTVHNCCHKGKIWLIPLVKYVEKWQLRRRNTSFYNNGTAYLHLFGKYIYGIRIGVNLSTVNVTSRKIYLSYLLNQVHSK